VGTDAVEGAALAMGFLDRFREKGASIVVTTHFDRLKAYGYLHPDIENVAVEFDAQTLQPRYTLAYGLSGLSNAFLVAEKLGISEGVLERARHYQDGGGQDISRVLETLEKLKTETEKERLELQQMKEEVLLKRQKLKELAEQVSRRRQEILASAEEQARRAVHSVEEGLKEWTQRKKQEWSESRPSRLPRSHLQRREILAIKEKFLPSPKGNRTSPGAFFRIGDRVRIETLRAEGILVKIEESEDRVEVMTDRGKIIAQLSDLTTSEEQKQPAPAAWIPRGTPPEPASSIHVLGLTVEEALPLVDRLIDQALLHGLETVQIIHGVGSGRLREGIGRFLRSHPAVKRFGPGEGMKGGQGITLVELV